MSVPASRADGMDKTNRPCMFWDMAKARPRAVNLLSTPAGRSSLGRLTMAGTIDHGLGVSFDSMRVLGAYALVLLRAGGGRYTDDFGRNVAVSAGDVLVITPEVPHAYGPMEGQGWDELYLVFDGPVFDCWAEELRHVRPVVRTTHPTFWERGMRDVASASSALLQVTLLQSLLAQLVGLAAHRQGAGSVWFARAQEMLSGPLRDPRCEPGAVAMALGVGEESFRKTFKRLAGVSPGRFRQAAVMSHACGLLMRHGLTLAQIAERTGHHDAFHFSKRFKGVVGLSPAEYRRQAGVARPGSLRG